MKIHVRLEVRMDFKIMLVFIDRLDRILIFS